MLTCPFFNGGGEGDLILGRGLYLIRQSFIRRVVLPATYVLGGMVISINVYDKRLAYEESIRIPFIVRYPALIDEPGRRASQMILNIDLAPTLLDIVGIGIPSNMQGASLKPILASPGAPGRKSWLYEHFPVFPIPVPGITAVRTQRYKYVEYQNDVRPKELYDLKSDPKEMRNIISTPDGMRLAEELKKELQQLQNKTGYQFNNRG
ncbi:hypothetical protein D1BOALGB6SA_3229 [Olavius sp. associated proteobacterium Delta 1]|nr:hypothetical protein D1BOALGB6SA_3229 [Olavius sp. associated proteobacterium Delta 1]